jgi:drug/metabolite transporter (DMT)-like permease
MAVAGLAAGIGLLPAIIVAPPVAALPYILPSALAETAYALCLSAAYRRGAMSLAYPIGRGTAPLLVTLGGWFVLAQRPTPPTVVAALALVAGLVLVATAGQHKAQRAAVGFALLTGVCIASYSLLDARAVRQASPAAYLGLVMGVQGLLLLLVLRGDHSRLRRVWRPGLLVAVGTTAAYVLVLLAFQRAPAGRVSTLREISVLIGVLIAGEKSGPRVWLGAGLVVIGAVLAAF